MQKVAHDHKLQKMRGEDRDLSIFLNYLKSYWLLKKHPVTKNDDVCENARQLLEQFWVVLSEYEDIAHTQVQYILWWYKPFKSSVLVMLSYQTCPSCSLGDLQFDLGLCVWVMLVWCCFCVSENSGWTVWWLVCPCYFGFLLLCFFMPPPLGARGIMFSGCPFARPSVCPSVRPKP